jgi:hypothetical protein
VLDVLDLSSVRAWVAACAEALELRRREIDDLNVFPVADGDTGTNLAVTMRSAQAALEQAVAESTAVDAATSLRALAGGAALAARGNSGVIMAQVLRGLADAVAGASSCDASLFRVALGRACASAYAAVGEPVEGTILTVLRAAADAVAELPETASLEAVVGCARDRAIEALDRTQSQLDVLAAAGVVDAGGTGLVVVFDALCGIVASAPSVLAPVTRTDRRQHERRSQDGASGRRETAHFGYEVQYLLDATPTALTRLRANLAPMGGSLTVAEAGPQLWNVHIHVDDVGVAIEAAVAVGRPHHIVVTQLRDQVEQSASTAMVVLLRDEGVRTLINDAGGRVAVLGDPSRLVAAEDAVLHLLRSPRASRCVLLPVDDALTPEPRASTLPSCPAARPCRCWRHSPSTTTAAAATMTRSQWPRRRRRRDSPGSRSRPASGSPRSANAGRATCSG